jgi:hypothetical protein
MDKTLGFITVITALISAAGALVSVIFSRRSALEAADQLVMKFREPLLDAGFNLETRIYNILELDFFRRFLTAENSDQEREYALCHTLYVFAQYFCWVEILRRDSQFIDPRNDQRNRQCSQALENVRGTFTDSITIDDPTFRIFRGEQRAIGEVMFVPVNDPPPGVPRWDCLGYAAFVQALEDPAIARWFRSLRSDIDQVSQDLSGHDLRLRLIHAELMNLIDVIDPDARRVPARLRRRVREPDSRPRIAGVEAHPSDQGPARDGGRA